MVVEERAVDLVAVQVNEVARRVGHLEAVVDQVRRAGAQLRRDVPVAEEGLEAVVAARLVRQHVGRGRARRRGLAELDALGVAAERVALGAVHGHADVVGGLGVLEVVGVAVELADLR